MKIRGFFNLVFSFLLLRYSSWNAARLRDEAKKKSIDKLHVGCGDVYLDGWLNILFETREEYGRIKSENGAFVLNYNLLKPWPVNDDTVEFIAGSHFIEHLDLNKGIQFLKEGYRVLKKGGSIRLSCPDLELYARHYVANNKEFFQNKWIREWCAFQNAKTPGEIFISKAYDSGCNHKWFYDFESLRHILELAGFCEVKRCQRLEGRIPDLEALEPADREQETLFVEAVKP